MLFPFLGTFIISMMTNNEELSQKDSNPGLFHCPG